MNKEVEKFDLTDILKVSSHKIERWFDCKKITSLKVIDFIVIHRHLCSMFSEQKNRVMWLNVKHPIFNQKPIDLLKKT